MVVIGIDIGTTKICAAAVNTQNGKVEKILSADNCFLKGHDNWEKEQNPKEIWEIVSGFYRALTEEFPDTAGIGITGQMHGIVYVDRGGEAVSPLYTWQDKSAEREKDGGHTYLEEMEKISGYAVPAGYGAATFYYHTCRGMLPANAAGFCSIPDYIGMKLTGRSTALCHVSNAAGIGLYNIEKRCFDKAAVQRLGIDFSFFPEITEECIPVGKTGEGIPVCVGIGDNQASFAGAVSETEHSIFVNVGTGSQISIATKRKDTSQRLLEIRPFIKETNLYVGSSLCGGRAFALLEKFYHDVLRMAGVKSKNTLYDAMMCSLKAMPYYGEPVRVATQFSGTRVNPEERGTIYNISEDNFTPESVTVGVLQGIVDELYLMYTQMKEENRHFYVVGAGNGIRRNPVLQEMIFHTFELPVLIPVHKEEAAYGAALFASVGIKEYPTLEDAQKIIKYIRYKEDV